MKWDITANLFGVVLDISALQLAQFETQQKRALIRIFKERIGIATASCQLYLQN